MCFKPFRFQQEAMKYLIESTDKNHDSLEVKWHLLKSPTGTGKTYVGLLYLYELYKKFPKSEFHFYGWSRVGIYQIEKVLNELIEDGTIDRKFKGKVKISIINSFLKLMDGESKNVYVVVDEAHHLTENGVRRNELKDCPQIKHLVGLTGTPRTTFEEDGFFECYLIERTEIFIPFPKMNYREIEIPVIEHARSELSIAQKHINGAEESNDLLISISESPLIKINKQKHKIDFVAGVIKQMHKESKLGKTIIFTRAVIEAEMLSNALEECNLKSFNINGDTPENHIHALLSHFKVSSDLILIGDQMINESLDIPSINTIVLVDQTSSDMLYSQWLGRGSRISKDTKRKDFELIDFRDNYHLYNDKEEIGGLYVGSSAKSYCRAENLFKNIRIVKYKSNLDIIKLCNIIREQNEYFGIDGTENTKYLSEKQVNEYLLLLCMPPRNDANREEGLEPLYQFKKLTFEDLQVVKTFNDDYTKPLEVPFVRNVVKPMVDAIFGESLIEETLESRDRIDMIVPSARLIIEFAMGKADEKLDQILRYHKQMRNNKVQFKKIIVGTSYKGSSESIIVDEKNDVAFLNWVDFFQKLLQKTKNQSIKRAA